MNETEHSRAAAARPPETTRGSEPDAATKKAVHGIGGRILAGSVLLLLFGALAIA